MSRPSSKELLILHAVRLTGFAHPTALAKRARVSEIDVSRFLQHAEQQGWVQHFDFADLEGWSLTDSGKLENERQLALELERADARSTVADIYRNFLPFNRRLVQAVTNWQIKPTDTDAFALNSHDDVTSDRHILDEMAALGTHLAKMEEQLTELLVRFEGYTHRYTMALIRANDGENEWIDKSEMDSCHRVWFELHEDLIATLGIDRGAE